MTIEAPSSFNQHIFGDAKGVYYGTDDGFQDGSFGEFSQFEDLYRNVGAERRREIHFVSAIGGLYGLNLMTCWQPTRITFFDINPHAAAYFEVIRRVFSISDSREDFLRRLEDQDYEVYDSGEETIRENLALKQRNRLPRSRGSSYKRSLAVSWKYALDRFELTRRLLTEVPLEVRVEGLESPGFGRFLLEHENLWLYCSNIVEFTYTRLRIAKPANSVVTSIVYPGQVDILDLARFGDLPVEVRCEIPMTATPSVEHWIPEEHPGREPDEETLALRSFCLERLELPSDARVLDLGCGWGRLALALGGHLRDEGVYEGIDPCRPHVKWAQRNLWPDDLGITFHVANLRNRIYNPDGTLAAERFRFPYSDDAFDLVVAHRLFPYLLPAETEHYLSEIARVLAPGGRLWTTLHLTERPPDARPLPGDVPEFRFPLGPARATEPDGWGLVAHRWPWLGDRLTSLGLAPRFEGRFLGARDEGLDSVVATASRRG